MQESAGCYPPKSRLYYDKSADKSFKTTKSHPKISISCRFSVHVVRCHKPGSECSGLSLTPYLAKPGIYGDEVLVSNRGEVPPGMCAIRTASAEGFLMKTAYF